VGLLLSREWQNGVPHSPKEGTFEFLKFDAVTNSSNDNNPRQNVQYVHHHTRIARNLWLTSSLQKSYTMGDAEIKASSWRLVEVGRVCLIHGGPSDGKLATIVEIIDHKRVCGTENGIGGLEQKY
jgi:hypothetical protein